MIKKIIIKLLPQKLRQKLRHYAPQKLRRYIKTYKILSLDFGHWNSFKKKIPVDANNNPIPWYTYPAIEYLKQFDFSEKSIFEWGGGYSSLFWSERAREVVSVDNNREWVDEIEKQKKNNNLNLIYAEKKDAYLSSISRQNKKFNVIINDGEYRFDCAKIAKRYLKDNGLVILDNSDWFPNSAKTLRDSGLLQVDFSGFGPFNNYTWTTSLFFGSNFNFKTTKNRQPVHSIGSRKNYAKES